MRIIQADLKIGVDPYGNILGIDNSRNLDLNWIKDVSCIDAWEMDKFFKFCIQKLSIQLFSHAVCQE